MGWRFGAVPQESRHVGLLSMPKRDVHYQKAPEYGVGDVVFWRNAHHCRQYTLSAIEKAGRSDKSSHQRSVGTHALGSPPPGREISRARRPWPSSTKRLLSGLHGYDGRIEYETARPRHYLAVEASEMVLGRPITGLSRKILTGPLTK